MPRAYILVSTSIPLILFETGLSCSKPTSTPIEQNHQLAKDESHFLASPDQYRRLVSC